MRKKVHISKATEAASSTPTRRSPRQDRARETVRSILQAAALVFAADGPARTTTNRIAERAGVSIGSLYQYFSSKEAILDRLLEEHQAEMRPLIQQALRDLEDHSVSLEQGLRDFLTGALEVHRRNPRLMQILADHGEKMNALAVARPETDSHTDLHTDPHTDPYTDPHTAPYTDPYTVRVQDALASRFHMHDRTPEVVAQIFLFVAEALTRWLAHRSLGRSTPDDRMDAIYIGECVHLLTSYVNTHFHPLHGNNSDPGAHRMQIRLPTT